MPTPVLQALVLADQVYVDALTGKKIVAGIFNQLRARKFPARFARQTYAFICLTEVQGRVQLSLRYVDLTDNSVLLQTEFAVQSENPLQSVEVIIQVPPFPMPHPGVYAFEVLCENEPLGALRVNVTQMPAETTEQQQ